MTPVQGVATPALTGLARGAEALSVAAILLKEASTQIEAANGPATGTELLAQEIRDVLVRVKAERANLLSRLPAL